MRKAGWVWNEAIFKEYIADPKKKLPGIKMLFPGIRDELNRDDLFAKSLHRMEKSKNKP